MSTDPRIEAAATALGERIDMHLPSAFDDGCLAHDGSHCEDDGDCIRDMATAAVSAFDKAATITTVEELLDTRAGLALANAAFNEGLSSGIRACNESGPGGPFVKPASPYYAPLFKMIRATE